MKHWRKMAAQDRVILSFYLGALEGLTVQIPEGSRCAKPGCPRPHMTYANWCVPCFKLACEAPPAPADRDTLQREALAYLESDA